MNCCRNLLLLMLVAVVAIFGDDSVPNPAPTFRQYCFQCHGTGAGMAGISLAQLTAKNSLGESFQQWQRVASALESHKMPPPGLPQPSDEQRRQAVAWIRGELTAYARKYDGDPGRVTVRRLTGAEYGYAIRDLTGLDLDIGRDFGGDSVGGEGFTNFGDVQFIEDARLERYLEAAKKIADHAVIGSGPLEFYSDPGKSGFEMSAISRIKSIYATQGFRTVSGEGGVSFGLEKYTNAFYVAWRYQHRAQLGEPSANLKQIAAREGVSAPFAEHIWSVLNRPNLGVPSSEVAARFRKLAAPGADRKASETAARAGCEEIRKFVTTWPSWLFARGDAAVGGAGDESPLIISDKSLKVEATHHFTFNAGGRGGRGRGPVTGPMKIYVNVAGVNPGMTTRPVVIWRNPTIAMRTAAGRGATSAAIPAGDAAGDPTAVRGRGPAGPKQSLRSVVSEETAKRLNFGVSPDGGPIGPDDFASESSVWFEVPMSAGAAGVEFQVDAAIGNERDQVFRITFSDREDGPARGIPVRALLGDPQSAGYRKFKAGVLELAEILPPNSNSEPTPADKDPIPEPFDSAYNVPEHDQFDTEVKYVRDDRFIYQNMLDPAARARVDHAWNDVYASFPYHDHYLRLIAQHYRLDLNGKHIEDISPAQIEGMPAEPRQYARVLKAGYEKAMAAQAAARPGHVEDCLKFASLAWRRPLTEKEKLSLRGFYDKTVTAEADHRAAIRALLARILVSPAFLYRVENSAVAAAPVAAPSARPLTGWEMASRLSFFLWSSVPDEELRRAAAAGELTDPKQIEQQVTRMTADPKARRLATEFFGQWLGFYHFDEHKGVDTSRFPEFTNAVKAGMYDESVSFFEHIIRNRRPISDLLFADYTFLNAPLAKFYGVEHKFKTPDEVELIEGANAFHRGGMLRLGAVLTAFSAPLRTSPVKRGDWVLRRILGTGVPPPPADAGSIPADDKLFGGLSVREKMEAHKRNATCANCHARIDPLGFPLEHYDSIGRWREQYPDGKAIYDGGTLSDHTEISGVDGLLNYLRSQDALVRRTLSYKLVGYALGRTIQLSDQPLIDRMVAAGGDATFARLAAEIAASKQFRYRVAAVPETAASAQSGNAGGLAASPGKVGER